MAVEHGAMVRRQSGPGQCPYGRRAALRHASRSLDGVRGGRCNRRVAPGPFAHLTISELKACAQRLYGLEPPDRDDAFYEDVEALRDELVLRSRGGGAGNAGVREPRRPLPSSDAAEIALEPPGR